MFLKTTAIILMAALVTACTTSSGTATCGYSDMSFTCGYSVQTHGQDLPAHGATDEKPAQSSLASLPRFGKDAP
jgi:hypothetical protein